MQDGRSLFVTSTGTEIGKTFVSALVLRAWGKLEAPCAYYKPVASGCGDTAWGYRSPDESFVLRHTSLEPDQVLATHRFDAPLSPDKAAEREGRSIDLSSVETEWNRLRVEHRRVVVEGIGGVAVPLTSHADVADLCAMLSLPVLLVVASGLGTISHTRTAVSYLRRKGVDPEGILLTPGDGEAIEAINRDHLRELYPDQRVEILPAVDPRQPSKQALRKVRKVLGSSEGG